MKLPYIIICVLLLLQSDWARAQSMVGHFTVESGLPSDEVYFAHQDRDGFMWLCTDRGLSRYDGYTFQNYSTADGLSHNTVFKCFEAHNGDLWFTAMNGTITIYDWQLKTFRPFNQNEELKEYLSRTNWIESIVFLDSVVYLLSIDLFYDRESVFKVIDNKPLENIVYTQYREEVSSSDNLFLLGQLENYSVTKSSEMVVFKDGEVNHTDLGKFEKVIKEFRSYPQPALRLHKDNFYVGVGQGAFIYDTSGSRSKLLDYHSTSIYVDREEFVWVTTLNSGVFLFALPPINKVFPSNLLLPEERFSLIRPFRDKVFVATDENGLLELNQQGEILNRARASSDVHGFYHLFFNKDSSALVWSSFRYDLETSKSVKASPIYATGQNWEEHKKAQERALGLDILEYFERYQSEGSFLELMRVARNPRISLVSGGYLYVKTQRGLMTFYEGESLGLQNLLGTDDKFSITQMTKFENGVVAVSFRGYGLLFLRGNRLIAEITTEDGLVSNMVNTFCVDEDDQRIWLGTNKGISVFSYENSPNTVRYTKLGDLSVVEGLSSDFIVDLELAGDKVWCLSSENLDTLQRQYHFVQGSVPSIDWFSARQGDSVYLDDGLHFSADQNDFEFDFVTITQKKADNMYRYRFLIDGLPQEWKTTDNTMVRAENLAPGSYTFEVASRLRNSDWGASRAWSFKIVPRFLDRLWVQILGFVLLGSIVLLIVWLRWKQTESRNNIEITLKDLELQNEKLQSSSLRQQMNPHFVFNALNSIQRLILEGRSDDATVLLSDFAKLIRSSLMYSRLDFIPIEDELKFLHTYLSIEKQRFPERFEYSIEVDDALAADVKIPPLLIQPIAENSVKHAFGSNNGSLKISIRRYDDSLLKVTITDDGKGYYNRNPNKGTRKSVGLEILESRIVLFQKKNLEASFSIEPLDIATQKGTIVKLIIPYDQNE